jgi:hypothetical protein
MYRTVTQNDYILLFPKKKKEFNSLMRFFDHHCVEISGSTALKNHISFMKPIPHVQPTNILAF